MKHLSPRRSFANACVILLPLLAAIHSFASAHHSQAWASAHFDVAQRFEQTLNQHSLDERTHSDYTRVINAYRRVYFGAPASSKAASSVFAAGKLLEEMGRKFSDPDISRKAIEQYEFLRREYPSSKPRAEALFRIGEVYRDDLHMRLKARATFEDFLKQYPQNDLASDAQDSLAELKGKTPRKAVQGEKRPVQETRPTESASDSAPEIPAAAAAEIPGPAPEQSDKPARVTAILHWSAEGHTRITIDLDRSVQFKAQRVDHPDRVVFDISNAELDPALASKSFDVNDPLVNKIRVSQFKAEQPRIVLDVAENADFETSFEENPSRLIIDVREKDVRGKDGRDRELREKTDAEAAAQSHADDLIGLKKRIVEADGTAGSSPLANRSNSITSPKTLAGKRKPTAPDFYAREAQPTASGSRSLIRALGLKIGKIVIDPGHGGHDTGTIGPNGLEEKDLVLDVSLRLGKLLENRLGAEVIYTRKDDTFIPLESRTAIANREAADLFVSVHANSSRDADARGVETYYLNFTTSPEALEVAARENAVSDQSIHELQDLVKKIALREKIDESREFATDVERALHSGLAAKSPGIRDRGVKKAPFIVLIGANMPSILAEISFVSNPADERRLETPEYRQRIAESLYRGIAKYAGGLSGVKVASKIDKEQSR